MKSYILEFLELIPQLSNSLNSLIEPQQEVSDRTGSDESSFFLFKIFKKVI